MVVESGHGTIKQQGLVLLHELWVVKSCHPFAVTLEVREFLNEGAARQPGEGLDQLVVHEVQISNVLATQVSGVA